MSATDGPVNHLIADLLGLRIIVKVYARAIPRRCWRSGQKAEWTQWSRYVAFLLVLSGPLNFFGEFGYLWRERRFLPSYQRLVCHSDGCWGANLVRYKNFCAGMKGAWSSPLYWTRVYSCADARSGTFTIGQDHFPASLLDLPCVLESYKTYDDNVLIKTADIGQVLPLDSDSVAPAHYLTIMWRFRPRLSLHREYDLFMIMPVLILSCLMSEHRLRKTAFQNAVPLQVLCNLLG